MSITLWAANSAFSAIMILLELRQIVSQGILYFKEVYNYLDLLAYAFVIKRGLSVYMIGREAFKGESR